MEMGKRTMRRTYEATRLVAFWARVEGGAMIHGFHIILSAYGFWLPNDPRGSWSKTIRQFDLLRFGPATKVDTTRSVAERPHDRTKRLAAKNALQYAPVRFTGAQARAIAKGFTVATTEYDYRIHALAILPDHAHVVLAWNQRDVNDIAQHLKAKATRQLSDEKLHPLVAHKTKGRTPSPWARKHWSPFIQSPEHMRQAIRYVEQNPIKAGLPPQRWHVVTPYR